MDHESFSYVLPIKASTPQSASDLADYIRWLSSRAEVLVVDGSAPAVFDEHAMAWGSLARHVRPLPDLTTPMGKVGGVLTGVRLASHDRLVVADDDVRYDDDTLRRVVRALDDAEVVRPQNYFQPMPWHARWDTGRTLLNRLTGGDWPGTLAVRRSVLLRTNGYDGRAMFENLELVRTVVAAGGREVVMLDALVARRPSSTRHFLSQRVRQAYDELARPARLVSQLALLPLAIVAGRAGGWRALAALIVITVIAAEAGRRRAGGRAVFPFSAALLAPAWVAERAVCSWIAIASRAVFGGIHYRGTVLRHAATPMRVLRSRFAPLPPSLPPTPAPRRRSA